MAEVIPRVLAAGLPDAVSAWLARRLPGASVQVVEPGRLAAELAAGGWSLLVADDAAAGGSARDALSRAPERPPVLLLMDRAAARDLTSEELARLGISRLFFHPLDREELVRVAAAALGHAGSPASAPQPAAPARVASAVAGVWERFRGAVLRRVDAVDAAALGLLEGSLDEEGRRNAEREAHKLAGSVGTFGFAEGSRLAREAEMMLQGSATLGQTEALRLSELAVALRRELSGSPASPPPVPEHREGAATLLVVDDDPELAERIAMEASGRGLRPSIARGPAEARARLAEGPVDAVLLDLSFDGGGEDGLKLLGELAERDPPVPVVVLTARGGFADRVSVARLGGRVFLQKPVPPAGILDAVERVLRPAAHAGTSVLAVDDDPAILEAVAALLGADGAVVHPLGDPLRFWEALETASPDLVMLDVDMPHLTGIELCRVVRNDPRWSSLPIIFLTARTDAETVERIFASGADDYVAKPIVGPELLTRVRNRLERVRLHRSLADTDPLTGVANRRRSEDVIVQFLRLAKRRQEPFSFAVIDLDHFKAVNDRWGHGTGDEVLRAVAKLLVKTFRAEDVVARWGGEEFVVGMFGTEKDDGAARLEHVLEMLRSSALPGPRGELISVGFSGGVAEYPGDGADLQALYRAADDALYLAKEEGRGRILPAGWTPDAPGRSRGVDVLVVDDDEALARLLLHALETRGWRTEWIADGQEAVDALTGARPAVRARVVLLDVDLPGLDGLGVLRALGRERVLDRTRVVMLTVRTVEAEVVRALEQGAFDHVAKPVSLPVLLQRVRRALRS